MTKKYVMLIKNDADQNNNKFYEIKLEDNDQVIGRNGRVGSTGTIQNKGFGEDIYEKVLAEKLKKKYRPVDVMTTSSASTVNPTLNVSEIAKRDIAKNNPLLEKLVEKLAAINRHQLLGASGGNIDIVNGQVQTPLGLITLNSIEQAKAKLVDLNTHVQSNDLNREYIDTLQDYLTLVPQKIPPKKGWAEHFFTEFTNFPNQSSLLEQIELSIKNYTPPVITESSENKIIERLFGYSLDLLEDDKTFDEINKFYKDGINKMHVSKNYKLKRVFILSNDEKQKKYEEIANKIGNVKNLFHGTRACNVLSILKGGLIIPPLTGGNYTIAGRMFGNSVYFSDQSTKSLNYATSFWTGGSKDLNELFMFKASVAMGNEYTPRGPTQTIPNGYHSIFAKANYSGVMNNEMVVPNVDQFKLDYLCEFVE